MTIFDKQKFIRQFGQNGLQLDFNAAISPWFRQFCGKNNFKLVFKKNDKDIYELLVIAICEI